MEKGYPWSIKTNGDTMLRVCNEIRIFPLVDLDGNNTKLISKVIEHFKKCYEVAIIETSYEFQKGANKLLIIRK